jgi:hypothetical protein
MDGKQDKPEIGKRGDKNEFKVKLATELASPCKVSLMLEKRRD